MNIQGLQIRSRSHHGIQILPHVRTHFVEMNVLILYVKLFYDFVIAFILTFQDLINKVLKDSSINV